MIYGSCSGVKHSTNVACDQSTDGALVYINPAAATVGLEWKELGNVDFGTTGEGRGDSISISSDGTEASWSGGGFCGADYTQTDTVDVYQCGVTAPEFGWVDAHCTHNSGSLGYVCEAPLGDDTGGALLRGPYWLQEIFGRACDVNSDDPVVGSCIARAVSRKSMRQLDAGEPEEVYCDYMTTEGGAWEIPVFRLESSAAFGGRIRNREEYAAL